jgi:hypothetical protein
MSEERLRDYDDRDEVDERLAKIVSRVVRDADVGVSYHEGGNGEKALLKWLLGLSATLVAVSIVGGVTLYGKVSAIEANQANQAQQANRMQFQIDQLNDTMQQLARRP